MKKIMILGAGIYQVPLIKKAKEMGLYVIVVSIKGNYPGFDLADKCYYENTRNYEEILKIAQNENVDGICTTGTDVAVKTIGYVCEKMNLCGLDIASANKATDKVLMKEAFKQGVSELLILLRQNVHRRQWTFCSRQKTHYAKTCGRFRKPWRYKGTDSPGSYG